MSAQNFRRQSRLGRSLRAINFHAREDGRTIYRFAKQLPQEEQQLVVRYGKELTAARSKRNLPKGVRQTVVSFGLGTAMWYGVCPMLSELPGVRDHVAGWFLWGGSDKLFVAADEIIYHTGGYSTQFAKEVASKTPSTIAVGLGVLALELVADASRCWTEYWAQKKYGIIPDGVARAYGQVRPPLLRYSALEVYQKVISYAVRPWTIGTPKQIFSSIQGISGSLWRLLPQLPLTVFFGQYVDRALGWLSGKTPLGRWADSIRERAAEREQKALDGIRDIVGEPKFTALRIMLAAEARSFWKWNPFRPAITLEKAEQTAKLLIAQPKLKEMVENCADPGDEEGLNIRETIGDSVHELEKVLGRKTLGKIASYGEFLKSSERIDWRGQNEALRKHHECFDRLLGDLQKI